MTSEPTKAVEVRAKDLWPLLSLEEVAEASAPVVYGILQPGPNLLSGVPYVRPTEIEHDTIAMTTLRRTSAAIAEKYARSALKAGDVILSIVGTIGKVALVPAALEGGNITQSSVRIRPRRDLVSPEYLAWMLRSPLAIRQYDSARLGTSIPRLNVAHVRALVIPVPPPEVQQRIVADIEKQFTRLEAANTSMLRLQVGLRRYRASVLKAACEGTLVETEAKRAARERRAFVPAAEWLQSVPTAGKPNRWKTGSKAVIPGHAALSVGNTEAKLPEGWAWAPLVRVAKMESGHTPSRRNPKWWDGDVPWISLSDARLHDRGVIGETIKHTNKAGLANSAARLLPAGTVCVSRTASIGNVVVMGRPMATSQDFVNWVPTRAVTSEWLRIVLSADREALRRFGKGSIHTTIYFPEWIAMYVAVPPLAEQHRIAAEVDRRLSTVSKLEGVTTAGVSRIARLKRSVLADVLAAGVVPEQLLTVSRSALAGQRAGKKTSDQGLVMPTKRTHKASQTRPLLEILKLNPNGITVEELFQASGHFEAGDPDGFYQELAVISKSLIEKRPKEIGDWPFKASVILKLKPRTP